MPGSRGEHLDPGGLFRVMANRGGDPGESAGPELAGERVTHPRVCVAVPVWAARVRFSEQRCYYLNA